MHCCHPEGHLEVSPSCVCLSSETELEEVLTVYTRLSRSAGVFLRTNTRHGVAAAQAAPQPPQPSSSSTVSVSPVKYQDSSSSSGRPRVKDQSGEPRVRQSSVDRHEGTIYICAVDLPDSVTLGRTYNAGAASPVDPHPLLPLLRVPSLKFKSWDMWPSCWFCSDSAVLTVSSWFLFFVCPTLMLGRSYDGVKLPHWVHILLSDLHSPLTVPKI